MVSIQEAHIQGAVSKLSELEIGAQAMVVDIVDPALKLALLRIGLIQGDPFVLTQKAPFNGPIALKIRGGKVALRASDAKMVLVKTL